MVITNFRCISRAIFCLVVDLFFFGFLQASFGNDGCAKWDDFSEKFQTAFDPPSFSENYVEICLQWKWLNICKEVRGPDSMK